MACVECLPDEKIVSVTDFRQKLGMERIFTRINSRKHATCIDGLFKTSEGINSATMSRVFLTGFLAAICGCQLYAEDLSIISADDIAALEDKVGQQISVEGVVKRVGRGLNDGIVFLNFGNTRSGFVVVIFRSSFDNFPDGFDQYAQKDVKVTGELEKFKDTQLQIRVSDPSQIEVVP